MFAGWWYTYPSEKYESVGMMTFPIYGKNKNVPNHQPVWGKRVGGRSPARLNPVLLGP